MFVSPKLVAILNFQIYCKNCKTQKCQYLEPERDRAILSKFFAYRAPLRSSEPNFRKNFISSKTAAILNCKTQKCLYLEPVQDRAILSKFLAYRAPLQSSEPNFQKKNLSLQN